MATSDRRRRELLVGATTLGIVGLAGLIVPLICVAATWFLLRRIHWSSASAQIAAGGTTLAIVVAMVLGRQRRTGPTAIEALVAIIIGGALFEVLASVAGVPRIALLAPIAAATFIAALAEEIVFRRLVPDRVRSTLLARRNWPSVAAAASCVVSQIGFAGAHAMNAAFASAPMSQFLALFASGIAYQALTRVCGLWAAAAVHAALNLVLATLA